MQRWLLALDEPASNPCGNSIINHEPSGAATATALAGGNQTNPDSEATKFSSHLPNERCTCNPDCLYAVPRIDLQEAEWLEADSLETDIPKFVTSSSTTTTTITRNNPRRCYRTSTSSGYSSHSPPLSAGSYSCYASAVPGQNFFRGVPLTMKDQFNGGLAVIHESEIIPRPIWPTTLPNSRELYHSDENPEYDSLYACCGCGCAYTYSYCDWDYEKSASTSAHDVLIELSRTLNSVIEGKNAMTPEEILDNISHKVAQGIGLKGSLYEYVYHNSSFLSNKRSLLSDKTPCLLNCNKNSSSQINPVNSKLYNTRQFYLHNPWYACLCACEHTHKYLSSPKSNEHTDTSEDLEKKRNPPSSRLVNDPYQRMNPESILQNDENASRLPICKCPDRSVSRDKKTQNVYENHRIISDVKETNIDDRSKTNRNKIGHNGPDYVMQLECPDGDSFNNGIIFSSSKNDWDYRMQGFAADLDFTLDVSRAERLGRAIAKAKRKRQWCRTLTAFFGLVFFVLSVVIVSLSVTRGRKVFGSM